MSDKCCLCKHNYFHDKLVNLYSGRIMKTSGNYYCTIEKKHKKLKKNEVFKKIPAWCPLKSEEDEG